MAASKTVACDLAHLVLGPYLMSELVGRKEMINIAVTFVIIFKLY